MHIRKTNALNLFSLMSKSQNKTNLISYEDTEQNLK